MISKNRKRITFIALESYSLIGGLQQFNRRVVSALSELSQKHNWALPIVILKGDEPEHVKYRSENIRFNAFGQNKVALVKEVLRVSRETDTLLLGHVNLIFLAFLAKIINPKIRIILFVHGVDVWGGNSKKVKKINLFLIKFVDQIASVSQFTAKKMSESFNVKMKKFKVFPNAVDSLVDYSQIQKKEKNPLLLTVSRLSANEAGKHHDSVLKALPQVLEKIPNVKYRIIGDGVLRTNLEELAKLLDVNHAVEFTGRVSDEELAKSYEEASVFVMPSEKEGFGIVFLEAWLRKIPVICGTEDASHEVITDGVDGYSIHHNNIELLSDKILWILNNPKKAAEMGQLGYIKVKKNYVMDNFVENLDKLLSKEC